jgi:hypothetical protein
MADDDYVEPISGLEINHDLCAQLFAYLSKDCNMRETDAYEGGYSAKLQLTSDKIEGTVELLGMDTISIKVDMPIVKLPGGDYSGIEGELEVPVEPSLNLVRERSEQSVPTITSLESGEQVVKQRRYVRHERAGAATGEKL